jgi:hypothetical protein
MNNLGSFLFLGDKFVSRRVGDRRAIESNLIAPRAWLTQSNLRTNVAHVSSSLPSSFHWHNLVGDSDHVSSHTKRWRLRVRNNRYLRGEGQQCLKQTFS